MTILTMKNGKGYKKALIFFQNITLAYGINMAEEKNLELEVVESSDGEVTFKVVEEDKVDKAIERMYIEGQQDLFDSETWNWSGLR